MNKMQDIITMHVHLGRPNHRGWYPCVHIGGCDRGHKGKRAAFIFDGDSTGFHCFNCGVKTKFDPLTQKSIPVKMKQILSDFGITESELNGILFDLLASQPDSLVLQTTEKQLDLEPPVITLPDHFYQLGTRNDAQSELATHHLEEQRGITPSDYTFYMSNHKDWKARLIIPIYKNKKLIFYQGRDLLGTRVNKYKSVDTPRECICYGYDQLIKYNQDPLYVVEGFFDAFTIDGIAVLSNELTTHQLEILRRSPRPKVVIPDRTGNGFVMANQAIEEGWSVSIPDTPNSKDISDAVQRYGRLYVLKSIRDNIVGGFEAKLRVKTLIK